MEKRTVLSRKFFIQSLAGLGVSLFAFSLYRLSQYQELKEGRIEFSHGEDIPMGVSYFGSYYLFRNKNGVSAFSTICTHAGCRIGKGKGNHLQCSCHGSQFDGETGQPLKGPAIHPLKQYDCQYHATSRQWVVKLQEVSTATAKRDRG